MSKKTKQKGRSIENVKPRLIVYIWTEQKNMMQLHTDFIPATFSKDSRRTSGNKSLKVARRPSTSSRFPPRRAPSSNEAPETPSCRWGSAASRFLLYMIRRKQNEKQPETQTALLMQVKTHGGEKKPKKSSTARWTKTKPEAKNKRHKEPVWGEFVQN